MLRFLKPLAVAATSVTDAAAPALPGTVGAVTAAQSSTRATDIQPSPRHFAGTMALPATAARGEKTGRRRAAVCGHCGSAPRDGPPPYLVTYGGGRIGRRRGEAFAKAGLAEAFCTKDCYYAMLDGKNVDPRAGAGCLIVGGERRECE